MSGSIGGVVASHNTYGDYFRFRKKPVNRRTPGQTDQRLALQIVSQSWRTQDPSTQSLYTGTSQTKTSKKGFVVNLTGQGLWMHLNLMRQRIGLPLITIPPVTPDPVIVTAPTVTATTGVPGAYSITFGADAWNATGGGVIVSVSAPYGPGVTFVNKFTDLLQLAIPGTSPIVGNLPFALGLGSRVKFRFHVSAPDGRQSTFIYVDLAAVGTIIAVTLSYSTSNGGVLRFSSPVTAINVPDAGVTMDALPTTGTTQLAPDTVQFVTGTPTAPGDAWAIAGVPVAVLPPPGATIGTPQSGTFP